MFSRCLLFPLVLFLTVTAGAQIVPTPTPTPKPGTRQANPMIGDNAKYDRLQSVEMMQPKDRPDHPLLDPKKGIYRRPGKEETAVLAVAEQHLARYSAFLDQPETGIVKLNADSSCISDEDQITASEQCLPFKMPGAGTSFSFRTESYRLPRIADIILFDGIFRTGGVYQYVVMAEIGDVPIEDVAFETKGMKYLLDLKPVRDSAEFLRYNDEIVKGIEADGFLYRKGHHVRENWTYILRSIAYRGQFFRSIGGVRYDELDLDRRRDIIVAFRVVERDSAGNVTIAWKVLKDNEAPKLKVVK
ncbi:MAG: hypothetical protein IPM25_05280 [Chloracidobacterium sp.]|nr:hypothetical protein [Chloracidobacterium sp.]